MERKKYDLISLSIPMILENFLEKNFTDSDPTSPPDPVMIKIDIKLLELYNTLQKVCNIEVKKDD